MTSAVSADRRRSAWFTRCSTSACSGRPARLTRSSGPVAHGGLDPDALALYVKQLATDKRCVRDVC
ncbi:hypothetical protein ACIHCV_00450 [Streptomyces sp. NPDC051956]|uniref:hypothetical protein n=1 Tax=Streptomyces sp. NPDC051956 TaxID=3365677 RepID=UPI0037CCC8B9